MKIYKIVLLALGHFMVDLQGIYLIHRQYQTHDFVYIALFFLVYNIIAFGFQPFFGYIADKHQSYFLYIVLGLLLPLVALQVGDLGIIAIIVSTIGNAMYHVGGGVLSLDLYPKKAAPAGVFVAPGAIGVFLGGYLAMQDGTYLMQISLVSLLVIFFLFFTFRNQGLSGYSKPIKNHFMKVTFLIFGVVFVRGMIGSILIFSWKNTDLLVFSLVISIFFGKFFGGILGDKFGFKKIGIGGLVLSFPLLLLGYESVVFGLLGAFCFNLTMAITLFLIVDNLGKYRGFAFGLTTLALLFAYLPSLLGFSVELGPMYYVSILVLVLAGVYFLNKSMKLIES